MSRASTRAVSARTLENIANLARQQEMAQIQSSPAKYTQPAYTPSIAPKSLASAIAPERLMPSLEQPKEPKTERKSISVFKDHMNAVIDPDYEQQLKDEMVDQHPKQKMLKKVITSPFFFGSIAFFIVLVVLYTVKPPFVFKAPKNKDHVEELKLNHLVVWGIAVLCFALVSGIPFIPPLIKTIQAKTKKSN